MEWWLCSRKLLDKQLRKGFNSLLWRLWKERNSHAFDGVAVAAATLAKLIWEEADEWCLAGYRHLLPLLALA